MLLPAFPSGAKEGKPYIGVIAYRFDDSFISEVLGHISSCSSGRIPVRIMDAKHQQTIQNEIFLSFLDDDNCKALIINPVDRSSSGLLVEKAKRKGVPIVFFNREPMREDMEIWEKAYYVGADAKMSGEICGSLFLDYYKRHPEADKNHDGVIQYVMLRGENGHQDAELRTEYTINTLALAGVQVECLAEETANWERGKAHDVMKSFLLSDDGSFEVLFANNDDMALGAIDAMEEAGCFKDGNDIPVFSVDGTASGLEALRKGTIKGSAYNDGKTQAEAIYNIAYCLAQGKTPTEEDVGETLVNGRFVYIPYAPLTKESLASE